MTYRGIIAKGVGGWYTVVLQDGQRIECMARGRFRHQGITPLPGDECLISLTDDNKGRLDEILERRNVLVRPPVANVDIMLLVLSETIPRSDPFLVDRLCAVGAYAHLEIILVINKADLSGESRLLDLYKPIFRTILTSATSGEGIEELRPLLAGKTTVITGNSGVGKSSLLNCLIPGICLPIGEVSVALGRGRHTTRHVELYDDPSIQAVIIDTPGFSALDTASDIPQQELMYCYPEFLPYLEDCRFTGCLHNHVLDCRVEEAVTAGSISTERYEMYLKLLETLPRHLNKTKA
jgi:ribosome biogenesis GTPase